MLAFLPLDISAGGLMLAVSLRTRSALSLALCVGLLGTAGCTTPCPGKPGLPEPDPIDNVSLEKRTVSDHHILSAHNDHLTRRIEATIVWTWTPSGKAPMPMRRTVTIDAATSEGLAFQYGKGTLANEEVVNAAYRDD